MNSWPDHGRRRTLSHRQLMLGLVALLLALILACPLGISFTAAQTGVQPRWWNSPIIGQHMLSVGIIPCSPTAPGLLILAYNAFISSRYPPPGLSIPVAPACP